MTDPGRRLLVVEDDTFMASLLADALRSHGFEVSTASDLLGALQEVARFDPDAALLDIEIGDGPSGIDLARVLAKQNPGIALIFLTRHPDPRTTGQFVELPKGCGFLSKARVRDTGYLADAIDAVLREHVKEVRHDMDPAKPLADLSARQMEVLRMIALGYTNERIATTKGVTKSSVERWTTEIFATLGIDSAGDLNPRIEAARIFIAAAGLPAR